MAPLPRLAFLTSTKLPTLAPSPSTAPGRSRANGPTTQPVEMIAPSMCEKARMVAPSAIFTPGPNTTCGSIVQSRPSSVSAENHTLSGSISVAPCSSACQRRRRCQSSSKCCQFRAAVDPCGLERLALDHYRRAALILGDHDDVGKIIFARRIGVADLGQPAEQVARPNRHHAGIAQLDRALGFVGILIFDHLRDVVAVAEDHPAIGLAVVRASWPARPRQGRRRRPDDPAFAAAFRAVTNGVSP